MISLNNPVIEQFLLFNGPVNRAMPLLLSGRNDEGGVVDVPREPMSAYGFMKRYVEVANSRMSAPPYLRRAYDELLNALEDNNFFLGDGAARHGDGRMKVVPDAPYLRLLTLETRLVRGAVDLSEGYAALAGEEFSEANVGEYCGKHLSESDAMQNRVWLALARGDNSLLGEFVKARFARATERFNYNGNMMSILPPHLPKEGAAGRLWSIDRLLDYGNYSMASGRNHLDRASRYGCLVGRALEAPRAAAAQLPLEHGV